jgi:hypothetical protein
VAVKSGALKPRFKHVDVKYCDLQTQWIVNFEYVNTKDNLADLLTKALPVPAPKVDLIGWIMFESWAWIYSLPRGSKNARAIPEREGSIRSI